MGQEITITKEQIEGIIERVERETGRYVWNAGMPDRAMADFRVMLNKAALFDVLAARIEAGAWDLPVSEFPIAIRIRRTGERVHGATLAEAVEKAMEAEAK